jgi:nitrogenase iron protein NifH
MRQIAIYGKGGIGKSTITSNLSAAFAQKGLRVLQVGCDPKKDSTKFLMHGITQQSVLEMIQGREEVRRDQVVLTGACGVECVEAGGPEPGVGCAGKGILVAVDVLRRLGVLDGTHDIVLFDVLGDVVCGGFAAPIRQGYAKEVYIVTSGEPMALYAANNICKGLWNSRDRGARLGGVIANSRNVEHEADVLSLFAQAIGSSVIGFLPRSKVFHRAEVARKTVIEHYPESAMAATLRDLATRILENRDMRVPSPLSSADLESLIEDVATGRGAVGRGNGSSGREDGVPQNPNAAV